ncbi:MAG: hypothetical protein PF692_05385 [Kiritimatiellae bacterium]|nr:hypothetical protein [Kiritimatiellia bacterium]
MKNYSRLIVIFLVGTILISAHADTNNVIELSTLEIRDTVDTTATTLMTEVPGVVLNTQGGNYSQNDILYRGTSFSENGVSLEGITLNNPQTEHFNAELPVSSTVLEAPSVEVSMKQKLKQSGNLSSTINYNLKDIADDMEATISYGSHESYKVSALVEGKTAKDVGVAAFGGYWNINDLDQQDNDSKGFNAGVMSQSNVGDVDLKILGSFQQKEFGATGYYGVSPSMPANEKLDDAIVLVKGSYEYGEENYIDFSSYWRYLEDQYSLILPDSSKYYNQHKSNIGSVNFNGLQVLDESFDLDWQSNITYEDMDSLSLGEYDRTSANLTGVIRYKLDNFELNAGVRGAYFSDYSNKLLPIIGGTWYINDIIFSADYVKSAQQPSYTALNYESPASLGNQGLDLQTDDNFSLTMSSFITENLTLDISVFAGVLKNAVDWVKKDDISGKWESVNLDDVSYYGADLYIYYRPVDVLAISLYTCYMQKDDKNDDYYSSRYIMNYPEFNVKVTADFMPLDKLKFQISQQFIYQSDDPIRTDRTQSLCNANLIVGPWFDDSVTFGMSAYNLWADDFDVYPGQDTAARQSVMASVNVAF